MKKIDLKKKAGVVACAAVMSMTMAVPCAFAAVTGNNGTTDVTVQTDPASTQCAWEAPTVIPFAAVTAGTDENAIQFNLKNGATDIAAATGMNTAALENFDMGYAGAANDNLTFDVNATQGKIARTTVDLSTAQKAATVSWTVAAGSHANA